MDEQMPTQSVSQSQPQESGTKRSFGNMLNEYIKPYAPKKYKKHPKQVQSPWMHMKAQMKEEI